MPVRPRSTAVLLLALCVVTAPLDAQLVPPSTGGIGTLDFLLSQLAEDRRVLVVGAHPDDEDTELLTLSALKHGADAAYLSLSRGEGGQNLVGNELGPWLGLLRTGELSAARSVDGAHQFFSRAYDFGFSKSLEETSRYWQPDSILKDVVRVIRRFKPHVVLTVFRGNPLDGHGHHQFAGVVARRAFEVAGDPAVFPELSAEEGLAAWSPLKLYGSTWSDSTAATLELRTGEIEPRSGRTYHQIAMSSRSRHRSQDMGRLQEIGPAATRLQVLVDRTSEAARGVGEDGLFRGIPEDTTWLASLADSLREEVTAKQISEAVLPLARAVRRATGDDFPDGDRVKLAEALATATGLVIDARADRPEIVPGEPVEVTVAIYNAGMVEAVVESALLDVPARWRASPRDVASLAVGAGEMREVRFRLLPHESAVPTRPYFLDRPLQGAMYDWSTVPTAVRGLPLQPPPVRAVVRFTVSGAAFTLSREVTYRYNDQAVGEVREPLRVVPAVDVKLEPEQLVWPAGTAGVRTFTVTLVSNSDQAVSGTVGLCAEGLGAPAAVPFSFGKRGESQVAKFDVSKPVGLSSKRVILRAIARAQDGRSFKQGVVTVSYPHIRPLTTVADAVADVRIEPIEMPGAGRIGYVRGAADRIPQALARFGLAVELMDARVLAEADLSSYDAIVVGSRAYEIDSALVNHNERLLDYVERGGTLIVLYQQYQFASGDFAPYEIAISRPHDRITDETAPVTLLQPDHAVFRHPNRIGAADWEGWRQERGLYFAGDWDEAYTPLLEIADRGSDPVRGGLLVARYGAGVYVYTGLSFFRAIPEGTVGAYRLFLNLIALGAGERR